MRGYRTWQIGGNSSTHTETGYHIAVEQQRAGTTTHMSRPTDTTSYRRGAYHFSRAVLPLLLDAGSYAPNPPTLIFTSATAAMKGSAGCASFATGKFAMRALAQSLAREFGPKGIHVNHAIIDGVIDIERTKDWVLEGGADAKIKPEAVSCAVSVLLTRRRRHATESYRTSLSSLLTFMWLQIADTYWWIHTQPRTCFSNVSDLGLHALSASDNLPSVDLCLYCFRKLISDHVSRNGNREAPFFRGWEIMTSMPLKPSILLHRRILLAYSNDTSRPRD